MTSRQIDIIRLGLVDYQQCRDLQRNIQQELIATDRLDALILCQHPPVITIGKSGSKQNLLISQQEIEANGIELYEVERGGDVTFHGPGQLVLYPLLNLHHYRTDVHWYMRQLEQVVIRFLSFYGIESTQIEGKTGVWTVSDENGRTTLDQSSEIAGSNSQSSKQDRLDEPDNSGEIYKKIASIGVRISRWRTLHGLAVNIEDCRYGFRHINPCGYNDIEITSVAQELAPFGKAPDLESAGEKLIESFLEIFEASPKISDS